jgi:adenine deaminase
MNAIRACTVIPARHYKLGIGLLQPGDPADLIRIDSLETFHVLETWIDGRCVASNGQSSMPHVQEEPANKFCCSPVNPAMLRVPATPGKIRVITAFDGQLVTGMEVLEPTIDHGLVIPDTSRDILKIVVKDRYTDKPPAIGFIRNFGLKKGAIASSVAHDSHNIVAIGADDESLSRAMNRIVENRGGLACVCGNDEHILPLPFGGIMSGSDGYEIAAQYKQLDRMTKESGCLLNAPFMTLSFMALLVIPELKMSDRGLFSFNDYGIIPLFYP